MAGGFKEFVKATLSSLGKGDLATDANVSALESKYAGDYRTFLTKAYEANGMDPKTLTDDVFGKIAEKYGLGTTAVSSVDPAVALPRPSDEGADMPNPNTLAKDAVNAALITDKYPLAPAPKYTAQERSILDPIAIKYFGTTAEGLAKTAPRLDENRLRTVTEELELMNADWDEKVRNNTATPEEQKDYQAKNRALVKEYDGLVFGYQREVDAFNKKIKNFTEEVDIATGEKFPDGYKTLEDASSDAEQVLSDIANNKKLAKKEDYSVSYKGKELEEKLPLLPDRQNFSTKDNALAEQIIMGVKNSIENVKSAKGGTIVGNFTEAAVKDFAKYFGDYITLGQTLKDNRQITALNEKTKRIAEGSDEVFTPGEASLIKALQVADKTAKQIDKDLPEAYRWGSIIGNSAGFMLEFAAFGGGAASLAKKGMIKMAAQAGRQGVMSAGKKASLNVGIKLATAGVKTPFQPTLLKNFAINKSNGETNGSALGNAYYDTFKDVFTEGMYENLAIKGIANPNMIQRLLAKTGNAAVGAKGIKGFLISTGQETLEEKTAEIMEGIKDVYQDKRTLSEVNKQFWDPMSNLRTVGTVGLMSGFFMGTDVVSRAYNGHKLTSAHKFNGTKLSADLRSAIDDALANKDLSIGQIQNIALNTAVQHAASLQTKEEKAQLITDAVNYAVSGITLEAFNQSSRSKAGVTYDTAQIGEQEFSVIVGDNAMIVNELFTSEEEANNVALELLKKSTAPEGTFQANVKSVDGGFEVSITPTEKKGSRAVLDKLNSEISYQETDAEETGAVREGGLEEERDQVGVGDLPSVDQQKEEVVTPKTETGEKGQKDGGGKAKEKRLLVEGQQIVNEPTVVRDVMNRPATLTKFGETEMEPVQGNVYQDGQQVVFETHDGKVYELGNVDEISDTNLSEMGLVPEVVSLKVNPDGTFEYNGEILVPAAEHAPSSIRYGKNGAVTRVDMRTPDGSITRSLRGQDAVEAAYTILLDRPNLDQELETVTVSADGNTADVAGEQIDLTGNLNIQDATGGVQQVTEIQANPNPKKVGRERIREQVIASSKRLTEEQVDQQMAVLDAMFQAMRPDLSLDEAYDTYIGEVTSDITKFGGQISQGDQGAIMWKAGKAVIGIFKTANASTLLHEAGGHLGRVILAQKAANDSVFKKHYDNAAKWSGAKQKADGSYEWTVEAEEKFARSFEKYVRDGVLPENAPSGLKKAFDALADMLRRVYVALRDINFNLSPEIREVFDAMLTGTGQQTAAPGEITAPTEELAQPAFHGSPHRFDKFTTEKIGTGEGAQAYGWGLYFTDRKSIAEDYAKRLAGNKFIVNGQELTSEAFSKEAEKYPELFKYIDSLTSGWMTANDAKAMLSREMKHNEAVAELLELKSKAEQDLFDIIFEIHQLGMPTGASSSEWWDFERGIFATKTKEYKELQGVLDTARNNKQYYDAIAQMDAITNKHLELAAKRRDAIHVLTSVNNDIAQKKRNFEVDGTDSMQKSLQKAYDFLADNQVQTVKSKGNVYHVELHEGKAPDQYDYLLWHKKIPVEQIEKVNNQAIVEFGPDNGFTKFYNHRISTTGEFNFNGKDFYETTIPQSLGQLRNDKDVSLFLLRSGIDGVQYPTQFLSKGNQNNDFNYVIFDESAVTIKQVVLYQKQIHNKKQLRYVLESGNFAMVTGENPDNVKQTDAVNKKLNAKAHKWLVGKDYVPIPITGHYSGNVENSFFVRDMKPNDVAEFLDKFKQESAATHDKFLFRNGTYHERTGHSIDGKYEDDYSTMVLQGKPIDFAVDYDFSVLKQEEGSKKLKTNDARLTQDFFSKVAKGEAEEYKPTTEWKPVLDFTPKEQQFKRIYDDYEGNFDMHIATSIPTFRETQIKTGRAITDIYKGKNAVVYDLGGSEGGWVKAITRASGGKIKSFNLDPNPDMEKIHNDSPVKGSEFVKEAFLEGWTEDDGTVVRAHNPKVKADVVHESMMFQFVTPEREQFVEEAKRYLKPNGIFVTEEKFQLPNREEYLANEAKKAKYKDLYFTKEQQEKKSDTVLVGMAKDQALVTDYEKLLTKNFAHVAQYWDSGNFKGYVASDSKSAVDTFLKEVGDTSSQFSTPGVLKQKPAQEKKTILSDLDRAHLSNMKSNNVEDRVVAGDNVSVRTPAGKDAPSDVHSSANYGMSMDAYREAPAAYLKNAILASTYPIVSKIVTENDLRILNAGVAATKKGGDKAVLEEAMRKADVIYEHMINNVVDNLLWLHDGMDADLRDVAHRWYDGANVIAQGMAKKYGLTTEQAAAILAIHSPQKDWFRNISLADRTMMIITTKGDFVITQTMVDKYIYLQANATKQDKETPEALAARRERLRLEAIAQTKGLVGKKLKEADNVGLFGQMVRAYDEVYNSRDYDIYSPNGDKMGLAKTDKGKIAKAGWGPYAEIDKAYSIFKDGSIDNISMQLGDEHKVRNFFNNINDPNSVDGYTTIDTHAVAAGLYLPLSGNSKEVGHNFNKTSGSISNGISGLYPVYYESYNRAADARGVLPRQMQSITWEAVRGLFEKSDKQDKSAAGIEARVRSVWNDYANNKITIYDARKRIDEIAKGVSVPSWARYDSTELGQKGKAANAGQLQGGTILGDGGAGRAGNGGFDSGVDEVSTVLKQEASRGFTEREKPDPKKTVTAYKLFRIDPKRPGQLFPLFVDANNPVPVGTWLDAGMGEGYSFRASNGNWYVPATTGGSVVIPDEATKREMLDRGIIKSMSTTQVKAVARRPGWHSGDIPVASHIGGRTSGSKVPDYRPNDQVWAEVEASADVDWQKEANRRGLNAKGQVVAGNAHITDAIPEDGMYRYKTNPNMTGNWIISGSIRVSRVLTDEEVRAINVANGVEDLPRTQPMDLGKAGFGPTVDGVAPVLKQSTIDVDGKQRPVLNSNGRQIHATEEGIRNFWRWFGDSKVVDEQGRPLVVYHGARVEYGYGDMFDVFSGLEAIGWFAENKKVAENYNLIGWMYSVYLSIRKPFVLKGDMNDEITASEFEERAGFELTRNYYTRGRGYSPSDRLEMWMYVQDNTTSFQTQLLDNGYDGIYVLEKNEPTWAVIKNPSQIKSASGNLGSFSPAEGSVLKQRSTPIENNTVTIDRHRKTGKVTEEATAEEKEAMSAIILKVGETLSKAKKQVDRITDSILYASTFSNITTFEDFQKKIIADLAKKNVPATLKDAVASLIQSELAAKGASGKPLIGNDQLKKSRMTSLLSDIKYAKTVRSTLLSMQKAIQLLNEMQQERQMQGLRGLVAKISKNLKGKKDKYSVLANDVKRFSEIDPELIINSGDPKMIHDYFMTLSSLTRPEADVFGTPAEFHQLVQDLVALTKLEDIENMAETLNAGTQDRALKVADLMQAFGISSKLAEKYIDKAASQPTYRSATVAHLESMTADEIADEYGMTTMVNGVEVPDVDRAQELLDRIRDAKDDIRALQKSISQDSVLAKQIATSSLDAVQDMTLGQLERLARTFSKYARGIPTNYLYEFVKKQLAKENAGFVSNMFLDALRDAPLKMAKKIFSMIQPKWYDRLKGRHLDTWGEKIALTGKTSSYIDWKDPARVFDANVWYKLETAIGKAQGDVKRLSDKYNKALMALYHKLNPEQRKKVNYWYTFYRKQLELNGLGETGIEGYFKQSFDAYKAYPDTKDSADRLAEVWSELDPYKITNPDGTISLDTDAMEKDMSPELRAVHDVIQEGMVELEGMSAFVQTVVRGGSLNTIPGYFPQRYNGTSDAQDVDDYLKKGFGVGSRASSTYERTKNKAIDFNAFGVYDRHINDVIRDFYLTPVVKEMKMFFEELRASIKTEGLTGRELLAAEKAIQIINTLERTFLNTNENDAENRSVLLHYLRGFASRPDTFTSKLFHDTLRRYAESLISHFTKTIGETISNIPMGLQYMDEIAIGKRISNAPIPRGLTSAQIDDLRRMRSGISLAEYVGSNAVNALSRFSDDMLTSEKNYAKAFNDRYDRYDTVLDFLEHNKIGDNVVRPINNFLISTGDRVFVHPAWNGAFEKRFKEITGSYVDREAFDTDPEYRVKYDSALRAAGQAADRVRARISNPTSKIGASLSDATGRYGWHWYARMLNKLFYGFGSRESNTLRANLDVIMSGKPNVAEKKQALREILGLYARNLLYQELMAALYIFFAGSDDDRDAFWDKFASVEYHARQLVAPLLTLGFGGLGNVAKIPIYYATEFVNKTLTEEFGHVYDPMNDSFVMAPKVLTPNVRDVIGLFVPGMGREIGKHYQYLAEDHDYTGADYINVATMLGAMTRMVPTVKSFSLLANKAYNKFNPKPEVYAKEGRTAGEMLDAMREGSKEQFDQRKDNALRRYVVAKNIQDRELVEYAKYFADPNNGQEDRLEMLEQIESRPEDWDAFKHAMKINMNMSSGNRVSPYIINVDVSYDKSKGVATKKIKLISEELLDAYVKYKKAK